jgi:hypothetical protein
MSDSVVCDYPRVGFVLCDFSSCEIRNLLRLANKSVEGSAPPTPVPPQVKCPDCDKCDGSSR